MGHSPDGRSLSCGSCPVPVRFPPWADFRPVRMIERRRSVDGSSHRSPERHPVGCTRLAEKRRPAADQAGKLAECRGSKLALTKAGHAALGTPAPQTLRRLWQRWVKNTLLDEFSRIDDIKGQHRGKGRRAMTAASGRRPVIAEALAQCPVGRWVRFDDFSRFMRASGLEFGITRDPWKLYIAEAHYGSLGYAGSHDWDLLEGRYLLCLLFEYAATLGMVDVAFIDPEDARPDFADLWGNE